MFLQANNHTPANSRFLNVNSTQERDFERMLDERIRAGIIQFLGQRGFSDRKVTDTPTDALSVVNRKYVNLSGTVANRPTSSVAVMGQRYFATDTNIAMTYNASSSVWANGVGSVVAQG